MGPNEGSRLVVNPIENLDVDRLLEERIGDFGRYQRWIYFLVCLPAGLTAAITMASVFNNLVPEHRCQIPVCDSPVIPQYRDAFILGYANFTIPSFNGEYDSCSRYVEVSNKTCAAESFGPNITSCDKNIYNIVDMKRTIVTDFDLICEDDWAVPMSESIFFAGVLVGAIVFGQLGDLIGRKRVFMLSMLQTVVCGILAVFSPSIKFYLVLNFLTAMAQVGVFQSAFVLGVELVGPKKRVFCGIMIEFFFVFGELVLAVLAWGLRDWKKIALAYMVPSILFLGYFFLLPRSIRWLIANQKFCEAEAELQKAARWNGVPQLTEQDIINFKKEVLEEAEEKESFLDLLRRPKLTGRLLVVFFSWLVTTMLYYGLSLNASSLAGNVFLNYTLLSLTEFPGYAISYFGMTYCGRKATMILSMLISGSACFISSLLPSHMSTLQTTFFLLGKLGSTSAFGTAYLYTSELFPTSVRNLCVGFSSMVGRIGAIVSPYIIELGVLTGLTWLPMLIFAIAAILSGISLFALHETKDKPLPRNLEEAEEMGNRTRETVDETED